MLSSTNSNHDCRVSQNYRMPNQQKRLPCIDGYKSNGHLRSNSPNPKRCLTGRRHSTPHLTGRTPTDIKSSQPTTMLKDYHPESSKVKERTPIPNRPELRFSRRRSRSLVKRYPYPDDRTMPVTPSSINTDVIIPLPSNRSLHRITEASTHSTSEDPSTNYEPIARKLWTQRSQKRVHDSQPADGINSDDETFSESSAKPSTNEFSSFCEGTCIETLFNCSCCQCYYKYPFCCWLTCLIFALGVIVSIFIIIGFFSN